VSVIQTQQLRRTLLANAAYGALLAGLLSMAGAAAAQEAEPPVAEPPVVDQPVVQQAPEPAASQEIVVTGSRIQNPNLEQSSPVQVINEDEIALQQPVSAEELIRDLPGAVPNIGAAVNNGANGSANVDLRGLGPNRNLVLLDGQRIVPDGVTAVVDVNNIPPALIERIDITTGGGSSVYGADAVAGVVNFITKRNFSGVELSGNLGTTKEGDGEIYGANVTIGANFDDGRGNAVVNIGYTKTDPIYQGDRDFSQVSLSSATGAPQGSGTAVPTVFIFPVSGQVDPETGEFSAETQTFNFNPYNIFQTPFERFNLYGQGNYEISDAVEVFAKGLFSHNEITQVIAPSGTFFNTYQLPLSNPFLPAGIRNAFCADPDVALTPAQCAAAAAATDPDDPNYREIAIIPGRRFVEGGPRSANFTTDVFQLMTGARGPLLANLDWEVRGQYGESNRISTGFGNGLNSRVQQALRSTNSGSCLDTSDGCVPFNLFGPDGSITDAMLAFIDPTPVSFRTRTSLTAANAAITGDFGVTSPWAETPIGIAVGAEYRKYTAKIDPDLPSRTDNEVLGAGGAVQPIDGKIDAYEGFAELIAPLVEDRPFFHKLTIEAGIRYSDYSSSGGSTAWKAGGSWEPVRSLKLRGIYQKAVRAPNIGELFTPRSLGLANSDTDPCQGNLPVNNQQLRDACIASGAPANQIGNIAPPSAGQINISFGGNEDLQPERATTLTLGAVFTPEFVPGLALTLDYFDMTIKDAITAPNVDDLFNGCYVQFNLDVCQTIGRNPLNGSLNGGAETPGLPLFLSNTGVIKTSGIDASLNYRRNLGFGVINIGFVGNRTFKQKFQATPDSINRECVGYYSVNCGLAGSIQPKIQWNQRTTLTIGSLDLSYLWRHIGAVEVEPLVAEGFLEAFRKIDAFNYFDVAARLEVLKNFTMTMTISNIFDKKPPIVGNTIGATAFNSGNTYPSTYDALGRRMNVGVRLKF
jgi:outer membrane receptor protein involved in Fe transport